MQINIVNNGPYIVKGNVPLYKSNINIDSDEFPIKIDKKEKIATDETYALCRCGNSKNKPFCDGSHEKINFDGKEIAKKAITDNDKLIVESESLKLIDIPSLCDHSRFCLRAGGIRKLIKESDDNIESLKIAKEEASSCPSGRLTIIDKNNGESTEKILNPEINLLYDIGKNTDGPIWVKGKIPIISTDGKEYEPKNRTTLCRCGKSLNKPECDGTHWVGEKFQKKFRKNWNID